jgi:hypothetical protein
MFRERSASWTRSGAASIVQESEDPELQFVWRNSVKTNPVITESSPPFVKNYRFSSRNNKTECNTLQILKEQLKSRTPSEKQGFSALPKTIFGTQRSKVQVLSPRLDRKPVVTSSCGGLVLLARRQRKPGVNPNTSSTKKCVIQACRQSRRLDKIRQIRWCLLPRNRSRNAEGRRSGKTTKAQMSMRLSSGIAAEA